MLCLHVVVTSIQEILLQRRTVHEYRPDPVPEAVLRRALEAALAAPCHRMTEPWRFVRVGGVTRLRLADIAVRVKQESAAQPLSETAVAKARAKVLDPPELLVVSRVRHRDEAVEREDYAAIACAIENLSLSLWAEGVGSKWSTGRVIADAETYATLGVQPAEEEIVAFVWIGMPAGEAPKPKRRRGLNEVLRELP